MDNQDEIFVVVNKNDKIVGYRTRYDCHHNKKLIHRIIGILVFNDKGEVLLQKRSINKDTNPGFYTLSVSGHIEKGETYLKAAHREMLEELGINSPLIKDNKFISKTDIETEMVCIFTTTHNGPFAFNKTEIDQVKFVAINQFKEMQSKLTPFAAGALKEMGLL